MSTTRIVESIPPCDLCLDAGFDRPAFADCRTVFGPWANLCRSCFGTYGPRLLGTGHGQRFILDAGPAVDAVTADAELKLEGLL